MAFGANIASFKRSQVSMPIKPELRWFYPNNWPDISRRVRFDRAGGGCEGCRRQHGQVVRCLPDGRRAPVRDDAAHIVPASVLPAGRRRLAVSPEPDRDRLRWPLRRRARAVRGQEYLLLLLKKKKISVKLMKQKRSLKKLSLMKFKQESMNLDQ